MKMEKWFIFFLIGTMEEKTQVEVDRRECKRPRELRRKGSVYRKRG